MIIKTYDLTLPWCLVARLRGRYASEPWRGASNCALLESLWSGGLEEAIVIVPYGETWRLEGMDCRVSEGEKERRSSKVGGEKRNGL